MIQMTNTWQFSLIFHLLQIIFIHYKSRIAMAILKLVVNKDDNGKFRLERVKERGYSILYSHIICILIFSALQVLFTGLRRVLYTSILTVAQSSYHDICFTK